ncbi:hypothetical protein FLONG3_2770 [Fusarium longipes]|uniref:BTB domain-containing protein n=1 Tax=Fusarium longipes TaxID=694270 RepID=A0A395T305_9HYPO|nr:hypothetical protein FLONG3_2770 [Fusarium longipes]
MNLQLLEKMRSSCPSRESFMDFINHTDSSTAVMKLDAHKPEPPLSTAAETKVEKQPLGDITNIQMSRDNSEKCEAVKEESAIPHAQAASHECMKTPTKEQADGCLSPITDDEGSPMINQPASSPYRYDCIGAHFGVDSTSEATDDDTASITSGRVELNPEAAIFTLEKTPEHQSIGSLEFEVSSQDLSCFDHEQSSAISEEIPNYHEAIEPNSVYYPNREAANNETSNICDKHTNCVTKEYLPSQHEVTEPQSVNTCESEDKIHELPSTNEDAREHAEHKFAEVSYHEVVDYQHQPPCYEYLDTIPEESEPEHDGVTGNKFIRVKITTANAQSHFGSSTASSSDSAIINPQISDSSEIDTTIIGPETPKTVISTHIRDGGKKRTIRFDRNGDLLLKVGQDYFRNMLVDSRALGRASNKLHAVISQNIKDDTDGPWTIEFPEDDPKSFSILLNLVHARFEKLPAHVTLDQLFGVCTLANKYNMASVLRPVAERWYISARTLEKASIFEMAFVAWELGFATDFGEIIGHITLNCSLDDDSQLVFGPNKQRLVDNKIMQKLPVLTCIEEHRQLALETFYEECQGLSELILSCSVDGRLCGNQHGRSDICLMLGKMFSKAEEEGVMDLFTPGSLFQHCGSLYMSLAALERKISRVAEYMDICGACVGVYEMVTEVRGQFERAGDPLYLNHIHAMAIQAKKVQMSTWMSDDEQEDN